MVKTLFRFSVFLLLLTLAMGCWLTAGARAEEAVKWYNPASWWYNTGSSDRQTTKPGEKILTPGERRAQKETLKKQEKAQKEVSRQKRMREKRQDTVRKQARSRSEKEIRKLAKSEKPVIGAVIETEKGNVTLEFYEKDAPKTVKNFKTLVENRFYNKPDMRFHRVVPGFVIQTGDPTGTGYGGSEKTIPLEVRNKLTHDGKGVVAMARGPLPDSATSQFYITLTPQAQLDGKYAIFGHVISGLDVLEKIEKGDTLYGIRLIDISKVARDQQPEEKGTLKKLFGSL